MKWVVFFLFLVSLLLPPTTVLAGGSADVGIKATGSLVPGPPTSLTLAKNGKDKVDVSWDKGDQADTTVVVRRLDEYPVDITDGEIVYNDTGTSFTDTVTNVKDHEIYYRAWSYNDYGYSTRFAQGKIGGDSMTLIGLIGLCMGLMVVGFVLKNPPLLILSGLSWVGFGAYSFSLDDNLKVFMPILSFCVAFVCIAYYPVVTAKVKRETIRRNRMYANEASVGDEVQTMRREIRGVSGRRSRRNRDNQ